MLNNIEYDLNSNYEYSYDLESIMEYIKDFKNSYGYLEFNEKKKLLKSIVKSIIVDVDKVEIELYFVPNKKYDNLSFCFHTNMHALAK